MNPYIMELENTFKNHADPENAIGQKAYMRNLFDFYGIKSPIRKELQRPFFKKENLLPKNELETIIKTLWSKPQRELQYFGMELLNKFSKRFDVGDIALIEWAVTHKSWWDTVDYIAANVGGPYFLKFPEQRDESVKQWINSKNLWLQRTALLFQLKYKNRLDTGFLEYVISELNDSKEFFINKAIGWILRQHSKTDPQWVIDFVNRTELDPLSKREALKRI